MKIFFLESLLVNGININSIFICFKTMNAGRLSHSHPKLVVWVGKHNTIQRKERNCMFLYAALANKCNFSQSCRISLRSNLLKIKSFISNILVQIFLFFVHTRKINHMYINLRFTCYVYLLAIDSNKIFCKFCKVTSTFPP